MTTKVLKPSGLSEINKIGDSLNLVMILVNVLLLIAAILGGIVVNWWILITYGVITVVSVPFQLRIVADGKKILCIALSQGYSNGWRARELHDALGKKSMFTSGIYQPTVEGLGGFTQPMDTAVKLIYPNLRVPSDQDGELLSREATGDDDDPADSTAQGDQLDRMLDKVQRDAQPPERPPF